MQTIKLPMPSGADGDDLYSGDLHEIASAGVDTLIYCYQQDVYEGSGYGLFRVGNKWGTECFSHCSCYGPLGDTDRFAFDPDALLSLSDIPSRGGEAWFADYKHLYDEAIKLGY